MTVRHFRLPQTKGNEMVLHGDETFPLLSSFLPSDYKRTVKCALSRATIRFLSFSAEGAGRFKQLTQNPTSDYKTRLQYMRLHYMLRF